MYRSMCQFGKSNSKQLAVGMLDKLTYRVDVLNNYLQTIEVGNGEYV
jgi:hypothetical protein